MSRLLNEWAEKESVRFAEVCNAVGGWDKLRSLAVELEAETADNIDPMQYVLYNHDVPTKKPTENEIREAHLWMLTSRATQIVHEDALDKISEVAAIGLASLANHEGAEDWQITIAKSRGPEYITSVLKDWAERNPGCIEQVSIEEDRVWAFVDGGKIY